MPDGGIMILTCLAALMKLLDDEGVTSFETDTTFTRLAGDINEWEVVIFLKAIQRGELSFSLICFRALMTIYSRYHSSGLHQWSERRVFRAALRRIPSCEAGIDRKAGRIQALYERW